MDAINALTDMRDGTPAAVTLDKGSKSVVYAMLWTQRKFYLSSSS